MASYPWGKAALRDAASPIVIGAAHGASTAPPDMSGADVDSDDEMDVPRQQTATRAAKTMSVGAPAAAATKNAAGVPDDDEEREAYYRRHIHWARVPVHMSWTPADIANGESPVPEWQFHTRKALEQFVLSKDKSYLGALDKPALGSPGGSVKAMNVVSARMLQCSTDSKCAIAFKFQNAAGKNVFPGGVQMVDGKNEYGLVLTPNQFGGKEDHWIKEEDPDAFAEFLETCTHMTPAQIARMEKTTPDGLTSIVDIRSPIVRQYRGALKRDKKDINPTDIVMNKWVMMKKPIYERHFKTFESQMSSNMPMTDMTGFHITMERSDAGGDWSKPMTYMTAHDDEGKLHEAQTTYNFHAILEVGILHIGGSD